MILRHLHRLSPEPSLLLGRWWLRMALLTLLGCFLVPGLARAEPPEPTTEERLRAAFVYKFLFFTEWDEAEPGGERPGGERPGADRPGADRVVCVRGTAGQVAAFQPVEGKKVAGRTLVVRDMSTTATVEDYRGCHLIHFGDGVSAEYTAWLLSELANEPILTVGVHEDFLDAGGMVRFVTRGKKLGFEVDMDALERGGVKLRGAVLDLAQLRRSSGGDR